MRILIILPYYFPYENPRAYRWTQIVREWTKAGWDVHVLTSGDHQARTESTMEKVYGVGFSTPDKMWKTHDKTSSQKSTDRGLAKSLFQWVMWPDESMFWIRPAIKKAREIIRKEGIQKIVTVSLPFSSHVVGLKLKNEFGLPWLIDIGDPFLLHQEAPRNNDFFYASKNRKKEKAIFEKGDAIVVTNKALKEIYIKEYPDKKRNFYCIPPMMSTVPKERKIKTNKNSFNIGYFGSFYDGVRTPDDLTLLLQQINDVKKIDWHFYGKIKSHHQFAIEKLAEKVHGRVHFHDFIHRSEVISEMMKMDILLSLGNHTRHQLPSKVVDYLAAHRPILHVSSHPECLTQRFFENYAHISFWKNGDPPIDASAVRALSVSDEIDLTDFTPASIAQAYRSVFV